MGGVQLSWVSESMTPRFIPRHPPACVASTSAWSLITLRRIKKMATQDVTGREYGMGVS
jgi:hypothetical protein